MDGVALQHSSKCLVLLPFQEVPTEIAEREFWRLVSSMDEEVSHARVRVVNTPCILLRRIVHALYFKYPFHSVKCFQNSPLLQHADDFY